MIKLIKRMFYMTLLLRIYFFHLKYSNRPYDAMNMTIEDMNTIIKMNFLKKPSNNNS